jgi:hypothetical protein
MEVVSKSIVIRIGDPEPLNNLINEYKRSSNTYFLNETDLVFPCIICDYEDFKKNQFNDQSLKIYISSWNLVKEINSNIYCKTESSGSDAWSITLEEKWEEIDDFIFEKLCFYIKDFEVEKSWHVRNLISYIRDRKLRNLI